MRTTLSVFLFAMLAVACSKTDDKPTTDATTPPGASAAKGASAAQHNPGGTRITNGNGSVSVR